MYPVGRLRQEVQLVLESHCGPWAPVHPLGPGYQLLVVLEALVLQYHLSRLEGQVPQEVQVVRGGREVREVRVTRLAGVFLFRCYPPKSKIKHLCLVLLLLSFDQWVKVK